MQPETRELVAPDFLALTIGIVVFFVGVLITQRVEFLRRYSIPEPVTGGFVAALVLWAVHGLLRVDIGFDMTTRDKLLVIFFATVGVNARLADLAAGGRVLGMLCLVTVAFVFLQDTVGTDRRGGASACRRRRASSSARCRWSAGTARRSPGGRRSPRSTAFRRRWRAASRSRRSA